MDTSFRLPVGELPSRGAPTVDMPVPAVTVAVGAHPDDVEFGCGATLARWAAAGCATHHIVLTDGSKGTWDEAADPDELVRTRQREQRDAAAVLGSASVSFVGLVDGELQSGLDERRQLCRLLRQLRPEVVIGHDPWRRYRLHPDHRHAGWLTVDAVVAARDPGFHPELGLPAHRPGTLLLFEPDEPNHVEGAEGWLHLKVDALLAHRSQYGTTMGIGGDRGAEAAAADRFRSAVLAQAASHGALAALPFGEAFHRIDDL